MSKIDKILYDFRRTPRMNSKNSLLAYWKDNKYVMPELYKLAMICLSVPMSQVSIERLFSSMKYILSDLRGNLSPDLLDDILLTRAYYLFNNKNVNNKM